MGLLVGAGVGLTVGLSLCVVRVCVYYYDLVRKVDRGLTSE